MDNSFAIYVLIGACFASIVLLLFYLYSDYQRKIPPLLKAKLRTTRIGDSWAKISMEEYGTPLYGPMVFAFNNDSYDLYNPFEVPPGWLIQIPSKRLVIKMDKEATADLKENLRRKKLQEKIKELSSQTSRLKYPEFKKKHPVFAVFLESTLKALQELGKQEEKDSVVEFKTTVVNDPEAIAELRKIMRPDSLPEIDAEFDSEDEVGCHEVPQDFCENLNCFDCPAYDSNKMKLN